MLKFILKSILICILFILLLQHTDELFKSSTISSFSNNKYKKINGKVDLAIFGSSHGFSSYDPRVLEEKLNLKTFNFSGTAQRMLVTQLVVKERLKENDIKLGIVDIFSMSLDTVITNENSKGMQLESLDNLPVSFSKLELYSKIFGFKSILNVFPTIRNHNQWDDLYDPFVLRLKDDYYNGFYSERVIFGQSSWNQFINRINKANIVKREYLNPSEKELIDDIINEFKLNDVPLIFVSAPSYFYKEDQTYYQFQQLISEYLKSQDIRFIDYNILWDSLSIKSSDFKDPNHLNVRGALKVSNHLAEIIERDYSFQTNEHKVNHKSKYPQNRYDLIENGFKNIKFQNNKINKEVENATGIVRSYLYNIMDDRIELLFEVNNPNKNIHLRFEYEIEDNVAASIPKEFESNMKGDRLIFYELLKHESAFEYNNGNYKFIQFPIFGKKIKNVNLTVGPKRDLEIFDINELTNVR